MLRLPHPRTGENISRLFQLNEIHSSMPGLPSLFLPSESENASTVLEIQAVSPPDERSWMTGEEIVAGE